MKGPSITNLFQPLMKASTKPMGPLGAYWEDSEGNAFRYCQAGASALSAGKIGIGAACAANHINKAPTADVAIGAKTLSITVGATAVTANQYAGGYLSVNSGTGAGMTYRILANSACASAGTTTITLDDPISVALTNASSKLSLVPNPYMGTTESTTIGLPIGVPLVAVPASNYYWAQCEGVATVLCAGTPAVGQPVTQGTSVAGSMAALSTTIATTVTQPVIGFVSSTAGVDTEYKPVKLTIE